jgi:DNA invertase Pin-like site-specific DNA recombinase
MDFFINILGWIAEGESNDKSARIKMATVTKKDGTYSYKGNRWGRKAFPTNTINRVLQHHKDGLTIREIAATVLVYDKNNNARNISKSAVHKILATNAVEKDSLFHNPLIK